MGVPGLWDILRPAGVQRSLTHLAVVDGFERNPDGMRGLRIGIDASIWFYHAAYGKEGENPELRTLFFRCARLLGKPFLPLFVFDGPKRPKMKRGKRIGGKDHWLTSGMQRIIEAFGFEWRMAPGEAEAELAYLNRIGVIDAIISDDVDTFLFGATMIIRNPSKSLSGNRPHIAKDGPATAEHVTVYNSSRILSDPSIQLTRGGLILIGLLRGGDYHPEGLPGCGTTIAHGLARCGFGDQLVDAVRKYGRGQELEDFLVGWREEVRRELKTDSRGLIGSKRKKLADAMTEDFPDVDVLMAYTNPVTSEREGKGPGRVGTTYRWEREPDLGRLAGVCELFFEWGVKEVIVKRFRTVLWTSIVLRMLRKAVSDKESGRRRGDMGDIPGTPSKAIAKKISALTIDSPSSSTNSDEKDVACEDDDLGGIIIKIHSKRTHVSTDHLPEYRLEVAPASLVQSTEAGVKGIRPEIEGQGRVFSDDEDEEGDDDDDEGTKKRKGVKKPPPEKDSHLRVWLPECMVREVVPEMVKEFEEKKGKKKSKAVSRGAKAGGAKSGRKNASAKSKLTGALKSARTKNITTTARESGEDSESEEDFSEVFGIGKASGRGKGKGKQLERRDIAAVSEESEEEEDCSEEEGGRRPVSTQQDVVTQSSKSKGKDVFAGGEVVGRSKVVKKPKDNPPVSGSSKLTANRKDNTPATTKATTTSRKDFILDPFKEYPPSNAELASPSSSSIANAHSDSVRASSSLREAAPFPVTFDSIHHRQTTSASSSSTSVTSPTTPKKSRKKWALSDSDSSPDMEKMPMNPSPKKSPRRNKAQASPQAIGRTKLVGLVLEADEEEDEEENGGNFGCLNLLRPLDMARMKANTHCTDPHAREIARKPAGIVQSHKQHKFEARLATSENLQSRPSAQTVSKSKVVPSAPANALSSQISDLFTQNQSSTKLTQKRVGHVSRVTYVEISSDSESDRLPSKTGIQTSKPTKTQDRLLTVSTQLRMESAVVSQKALTERTNSKTLFDYLPVNKSGAKMNIHPKSGKSGYSLKDVEVIDLT